MKMEREEERERARERERGVWEENELRDIKRYGYRIS